MILYDLSLRNVVMKNDKQPKQVLKKLKKSLKKLLTDAKASDKIIKVVERNRRRKRSGL